MINWNKELVETILNRIKEKNQDSMSCINDIGSATPDSITRRIDDAEYCVEQLDSDIGIILSYLFEDDDKGLKEYLE